MLAQSFRRGRTNIVMVVLPSVGDPFFSAVMRGIRIAASAQGYSVIFEDTQFNEMIYDNLGTLLVSNRVDGLILLASISPLGNEILSSKTKANLPVVIGCETGTPELSEFLSVHIDNVSAAREATNLLISQGHQRTAMVCGQASSLLTKDREVGYRIAMKENRLPIKDGWVFDGDLSISGARKASRSLMNHDTRPTAIFCANDEMVIGCIHEIESNGMRVPRDISVLGFDDIQCAEVTDPPLATDSQPAEEIGERVMYRLCRSLRTGPDENTEAEVVPCKLVVRLSVARPSS